MAEKKTTTKVKTEAPKVEKTNSLSVPMLNLAGKESGNLTLPAEIFGVKVNEGLLAQAIRVYTTNQKAHWGSTKTRGEMSYSTIKVYRQKGTGRARHGSKSAPIYVHSGGVALGPKFRKTELDLPKKMKKAALISALSQKAANKEISGIMGLDKASGKTKEMNQFIKGLNKKSALIVAENKMDKVFRSVRNLENVEFLPVEQVNVYQIIKHQSVLLTKEAIDKLQEKLTKQEKKEVETKAGDKK